MGIQTSPQLTFSLYESIDQMMMYERYYRDGAWGEGALVPFHNIELSPAANILNYGQGVFEGMKAYRTAQDKIVLFRPEMNARRFRKSCRKLAIPEMPEEEFLEAVRQVVLANRDFIPQSEGGKYSLYIRPVCIGIEPMLGVRASREYLFYIYASPVGPYFDKIRPVRLMITDVHRAATNGTGDAKAVCNYAVTMRPVGEAKKKGLDGVIFLDTVYDRFVEEANAANLFAVLDNDTLVTPQLGTILPGVIRDSILRIGRELLGMTVLEAELRIEELCLHAKECFLCGTGAIVTPVSEIHWKNKVYSVNKNEYQVSRRVHEQLLKIQLQEVEDPFGWVVELT